MNVKFDEQGSQQASNSSFNCKNKKFKQLVIRHIGRDSTKSQQVWVVQSVYI